MVPVPACSYQSTKAYSTSEMMPIHNDVYQKYKNSFWETTCDVLVKMRWFQSLFLRPPPPPHSHVPPVLFFHMLISEAALSCHRCLVFFFDHLLFFKDSHLVLLATLHLLSPHVLHLALVYLRLPSFLPLWNIVSGCCSQSLSVSVLSWTQLFSLKPSMFSI